jgi:PBP1b-binding outer membrane lipoprotein LpoB
MIKKTGQISLIVIMAILIISCKNTKQKLQEYVTTYNSTAASFKADDVTLTTARGYINDNKIELRFETGLEQKEANKEKANTAFPKLLKEMIHKNQIPKELVEEGVQFDVYFLANDNTVLVKEALNKESIAEFL